MITITNKTITADQPSIVYVFGKDAQGVNLSRRYELKTPPYQVVTEVPDGSYKIVQETLKGVQIPPVLLNQALKAETRPSLMQWGVVANFEDNADFVIQVAKAAGVQWVRTWKSPHKDVTSNEVSDLRKYRAAGLKVVYTIQPNEGWKLADINFATWCANNRPAIVGNVDAIEALNELCFSKYRAAEMTGSSWHQMYVDKCLNPIIDAFPEIPVIVVPIADNYTPMNHEIEVQKLRMAGAYRRAKYAGMHPYAKLDKVDAIEEQMAKTKAISGLPIFSTEFNIVTKTSTEEWLQAYPKLVAAAKKHFSVACYYRAIQNNEDQKGLITRSNARLQFYDTFKAAM